MARLPGAAAVLAGLLLLAGCGDAATPATGANPASLELRREGGIAGVAELWLLSEDGTLLRPPSDVAEIVPDAEDIFDRVHDIGFFDLDDEYLPDDPCCDRFTYTLRVTDGDRTHRVVTMDDGGAPGELVDLIGDILAAAGS